MYTQLLHLIHILLLLVNNVVGVHAVRMVDSLYYQCSAYDLVLILDDNKVFVFVFDRSNKVFVFVFVFNQRVAYSHRRRKENFRWLESERTATNIFSIF